MKCIFHTADGRITLIQDFDEDAGPPDLSAYIPAGGGVVAGNANIRTDYVSDGARTARPVVTAETEFRIAADGVDEVSFEIPAGTRVIYGGKPLIAAADELFEFVTDLAGEYQFEFRPPWPWINSTIRIVAR